VLAGHRDDHAGRDGGLVRQHRLIARVVQHGTHVVAHAAVDSDVGAHAGDLLDGPDRVGSDSRLTRDRAPGLDEESGKRHAPVSRLRRDRLRGDGGELGDRRRPVLFRIADAETAADVEQATVEVELAAPHLQGGEQRLDLAPVGIEGEDLRTDVGVHADEVERRRRAQTADGLRRRAVLEPEAELAVDLTGLHEAVRARADPRCQAHEHLLPDAARRGGALETFDLGEGVDDEGSDADVEGKPDLGCGLVVPVEVDAPCREGGEPRRGELAARGHVQREPFLGDELTHGAAGERLARVDDLERTRIHGERLEVRPALSAQGGLVVDEERRPERVRQLDDVAAPDLEMTVGVVTGGLGVDQRVRHARDSITPDASIPVAKAGVRRPRRDDAERRRWTWNIRRPS